MEYLKLQSTIAYQARYDYLRTFKEFRNKKNNEILFCATDALLNYIYSKLPENEKDNFQIMMDLTKQERQLIFS